MADLTMATMDGSSTKIGEDVINALTSSLRGDLLTPDTPGYDEVRAIWNAMIDRRPVIIVRCAGVEDVMRSVALARDHQALVAVRGGGHNIAGNAVCGWRQRG